MFKKRIKIQLRYFIRIAYLTKLPFDLVVSLYCARFRRLYNRKHLNMR